MVHICKMIISPGFFSFFQNFNFLVVSEVKVQKMVQNDKNVCQSRSISQEPYIIWLSFMLHMSKMIISPGFFFIFSKFWFSGLLVGWKGKKWPKMRKYSVCLTLYIRNHTSYDCDFLYTCVNWWYLPQNSSFWFFVFRGVKSQKMTNLSLSRFISQELYIISSGFLVHRCQIMIFPAVFFFYLL